VVAGVVNISINRAGIASGPQPVTLNGPVTVPWNSATPPAVTNGAMVTIATGAAGTLIVPENATVTINSAGTGWVDNGDRAITLNISEGARVVWRARYRSTRSMGTSGAFVPVTVVGSGTLEVADGNIYCFPTVPSLSSRAIYTSSNSTILVSGGSVGSWPQGWFTATIASTNASGTVTVSGGVVRAYGHRSGGQAISVAGALNITGGLVIAESPNATGFYGVGVVNRVPNTITNGTIIGYALGGSHASGAAFPAASFLPASANVHWFLNNGWETGIRYRNNIFVPRSGVSVGNRIVWNSDRVPWDASIATNSTITIAEGASGTLAVPASVTTTITSQGTGAVNNGNRQIFLDIGANSTVNWNANYNATLDHWNVANAVTVRGNGTLNVTAGSINSIGGHRAIHADISWENSTIIVSGGVVSAEGNAQTILSTGGSVTVSGGQVRATTGTAIHSTSTSATAVTVSGSGVVSATTGQAINAHVNGTFRITGGLVVSQRNLPLIGPNGVVNREPNALTGTIARYSTGTYAAGSVTNLSSNPPGVIRWGASGGQSAISFPGGVFSPVPGVTVTGSGF